MKKLQFSIEINAPKEKVWDALWQDENYRNWTSVFMEGSFKVGDFIEGNEILFLSPDENGVFAVIEKLVPLEKMYFLHLGEVEKGIKQDKTYGDDAIERYDLTKENGVTSLTVTINAPEDCIIYFTNTFPKALEKVKQISEN